MKSFLKAFLQLAVFPLFTVLAVITLGCVSYLGVGVVYAHADEVHKTFKVPEREFGMRVKEVHGTDVTVQGRHLRFTFTDTSGTYKVGDHVRGQLMERKNLTDQFGANGYDLKINGRPVTANSCTIRDRSVKPQKNSPRPAQRLEFAVDRQ